MKQCLWLLDLKYPSIFTSTTMRLRNPSAAKRSHRCSKSSRVYSASTPSHQQQPNAQPGAPERERGRDGMVDTTELRRKTHRAEQSTDTNGTGTGQLSAPSDNTVAPSPSASPVNNRGFDNLALGNDDVSFESEGLDTTRLEWMRKTPNSTLRSLVVYTFFIRLRLGLWWIDNPAFYPNSKIDEAVRSRRRAELADYCRRQALILGPTFIKVFQLAGARIDLLPPEFVKSLSRLQDKVPAMDKDEVRNTFVEEFGMQPEDAYDSFDWTPLASASLSQVHRARFNGEDVVVKVQRTGLRQLFDIDLAALKRVAQAFDLRNNTSDFTEIWKECSSVLYGEIDFIREGMSADRFRRANLDVKVPRVFWRFTSGRVITLEYCEGIKITDTEAQRAQGLDPTALARKLTEIFFESFFIGIYQADPHPGNIVVRNQGDLVFLDYGMFSVLKGGTTSRLKDLFRAVYRKDTKTTLDLLVELEIVTGGDRQSLQRAIAFFLNRVGEQASNRLPIANIGDELFSIASDSPIRFPSQFVFLLRALSTLEGVGKSLDPSFSIAGAAQPYATRLLSEDNSENALADTFTEQVTTFSSALSQMPSRVERIERIIGEIESGELKPKTRVIEAEIALRRASIMQVATIEAVASMGLVNLGIDLSHASSVSSIVPNMLFLSSAALAGSFAQAIRRVNRINDFRQRATGRGSGNGEWLQ